jgi:alginate O-acetyltransferase complex protein AlgI
VLFVEARFFVFFAAVFAVYWTLRTNRARKLLLLAASYAFYAAWDWRFLSLIALSTGIDYLAAHRIRRSPEAARRRAWLTTSIAVNLGLLAAFKYFGFFVESATALLGAMGFGSSQPTLAVILPVGISFYTFQSMSYSLDVYRGRIAREPSALDFALFVGFFPQLVAGPIVRARSFLPQLEGLRSFDLVRVRSCLLLFGSGFVKKACIADRLALAVDPVFATPDAFDAASHWLAIALYHAQIYCDFSGYTDMAIATAGLLGYRLTANFDFPYLAGSMRDYWRRWHISLSSWFRDYLYVPLGGNREGVLRTARNLLVVFVLCGLWHGANWTFVVWGLFHGAWLIAERGRFGGWLAARSRGVQLLYVQVVACLAWVFFRSPDLGSALTYLGAMFGAAGGAPTLSLEPSWAVLWLALASIHVLVHTERSRFDVERVPDWVFALAYGAAAALTLPWIVTTHAPFIYFQF